MGFFGKKTYYVNFDWDDVALESSTFVDSPSGDIDAIVEEAKERLELPEGQQGTWSIEEATDMPRKRFLGLF